ncbi:DUF3300 domain-containing protein [Burkholderia sp. Ax-1724]|uniref:DUF3300 domain-containing protein n=1 Tax=Burkholderia sp. Ax-1724 TaxID=2608336 RepID=UPI00141DA92D|nr:DUF3300 domain-containing protein [Burkholderia sp. Ax-1724]NIF54708.1 DUF3300 domain-containing protein [Burkholderia sp. Ax-1724]
MKKTLPFYDRHARTLVASSLVIALLGLSACNQKSNDSNDNVPAASQPAAASVADAASAASAAQPAPVAYTPPSADQLYQLVAPIALFPDKLVALVLAGSTYPDQIEAANTWLGQNPTLKGTALTSAADAQPWDASVKALAAFPATLSQMASNMEWTTALGQAYYHDPNDVLNAIQVMRQRAKSANHLSSGSQLRVTQTTQSAPPPSYTPAPSGPAIYEGPPIVPPPPQTIVIEPTRPDMVYVPVYNPAVVYGTAAVYPGYAYRPVYGTGAVVTAGVLSFGVGIAVGALFSHHDWGWHAWDVNWGAPHAGGPAWGNWQRPAVVYDHKTYISKSTTVVNNINNVHNTRITNNYGTTNNNVGNLINRGAPPAGNAAAQQMREQAARGNPATMSMPHFGANAAQPGERPTSHAGGNHPNAMGTPSGAQHSVAQMHAQRGEPPQGAAHPPADAMPGPNGAHEPNAANGTTHDMPMRQEAEQRSEAEAQRNVQPAPTPQPQQHEMQQHEAPSPAQAPRPAGHAPHPHPARAHAAAHPQGHARQERR